MQYLTILLLHIVVIFISGCGWHIRNSIQITDKKKTMIFESSDPNSFLSQTILNQLHTHGFKIIDKSSLYQNQGVLLFRVVSSRLSRDTVSIFRNGQTAEYKIIISVKATLLIPDYGMYPIDVTIDRSFFENPHTALAKEAEQHLIIKDMYEKIAEKLISSFLDIQLIDKKFNKNKSWIS